MAWISIDEFTTQTGISVSDESLVTTALSFAEKDIIRHLFLSKEYRGSNSTSSHSLGFYPMDNDGDKIVNTGDVDCYEFDSDNNYYSLNTSLTEVNSREQKVKFDISVPTDGRNLHIEYKTGRERFNKMLIELQELEIIKAANWFYNKIPIEKLQQGISNWSINGVSVSFDNNATTEVFNNNKKLILELYDQLRIKKAGHVRPGRATKSPMFYTARRMT